ncbi:hypothetical protein APHAL10511_007913 [Amanita phalloides]|nr:hypothetical protein APHAL10511_007913 [Amanita phalloides]
MKWVVDREIKKESDEIRHTDGAWRTREDAQQQGGNPRQPERMQRVWSTYLDERAYRTRPHMPGLKPIPMESSPPSSRRGSFASQTASTRHMLSESHSHLDPPTVPFAASPTLHSAGSSPALMSGDASSISLSINYLPKKFSSTLLNAGNPRRRRLPGGAAHGFDPKFPKQGKGVDAFRSGQARMPSADDDEYNSWLTGKRPKKMKWNRFKCILFFTNLLFTIYTVSGLIVLLLTWFNAFAHADIVLVGNRAELVLSTFAAICGLITSIIGWAGILLNNRSFLAVYTFLTWITFALLVTPGYVAYKKRTFNLEGKINLQWSRDIGTSGRLKIQNVLQCCGYYSPYVEATVTATCYSRSVLPGCKAAYFAFEKVALKKFYSAAFALVPLQIMVMVAGLLCSNHVTYRFGKGMMPKAYRLSLNSMALIMDQYASQLAEQYGKDVATEVMARSRANLSQFDSMPTMPYQTSSATSTATPVYHAKYDSIGARTPETML